MKPKEFKWIGEDKAIVELQPKEHFSKEDYYKHKAAQRLGIPFDKLELVEDEEWAGHPNNNWEVEEKPERIHED